LSSHSKMIDTHSPVLDRFPGLPHDDLGCDRCHVGLDTSSARRAARRLSPVGTGRSETAGTPPHGAAALGAAPQLSRATACRGLAQPATARCPHRPRDDRQPSARDRVENGRQRRRRSTSERVTGIGPAFSAWEGGRGGYRRTSANNRCRSAAARNRRRTMANGADRGMRAGWVRTSWRPVCVPLSNVQVRPPGRVCTWLPGRHVLTCESSPR
jgi:hypothetical protein